jgi:hypothetical protein
MPQDLLHPGEPHSRQKYFREPILEEEWGSWIVHGSGRFDATRTRFSNSHFSNMTPISAAISRPHSELHS